MGAESAEDEAELVVAIAVPVETAEHEEPAAGRDLGPHPRQVVGHRGEREFFTPHRGVIRVAAPQAAHRGVDLLECRRRQPDDPVVGLYEVPAKPNRPSTRTIRRLECHRHLLHSCRLKLVLHHLRPPFAGSNNPQSIAVPRPDHRRSAGPPVCRALGPRPRLMWPWHSCHLYSWTSLDGRSPWSDGLPPSPSSSSCRWLPPTRRLGRTGTQRDR